MPDYVMIETVDTIEPPPLHARPPVYLRQRPPATPHGNPPQGKDTGAMTAAPRRTARDGAAVRSMLAYIGRLHRSQDHWARVAERAERPSAPRTLDEEMYGVLLELMLVSSGTTASYNATGGGEKTNPVPPGESLPPHDYWARQYALQETDTGRREIIHDAREDLKRLAGQYERNTQGETPDEYRARLLTETAGWSPIDVERSAWRTSEKVVRKLRAEDGRWPETGHKIDADQQPVEQTLAERVAQYDTAGFSERQIAMLVGEPKSKVRRLLGRAA